MSNGNLGNLWYELDIKDNSQAKLQNIIQNIEAQLASAGKKGVTIGGIKVDPKAGQDLVNRLRNILHNSGGLRIDKLDVGKALRLQIDTKNVQDQLDRITFRGKLALDVNPAELQAAVSRALRSIPPVQTSQIVNVGGSAASINSTAGAVRDLNKQMSETTALGEKVKSVLTQAFSVYAVKNFLSEVISIGGELEKQRLAMGNIIGDMYEANELTKKVANLSMISPFTVQELQKATRLLTAYGVQYNEVYDITKRLSDIAAGVGVGFERIAYAFGHITSMGNLDARTLRMFQNMGVPLLQKLSDYYQETQGKSFTTAQVRKMITDKQVSSTDVINVLKQMTDAGGQFYQMQEVMAESLATKWANLANAWNLMLGDMAEDPAIGGNLKTLAEVLTGMTQNWKNVKAAMYPVLGYLLTMKANSLMAASAVTTEMVANQKSILAMKAKRAEYLQTKEAGWQLVAANRELVATVDRLTVADYKHAIKTGMITKEMIAQVIASKQLSLQDSVLIGKMAGMNAMTATLTYRFGALGMAAKAFATTLKGIALNPMTWAFAAAEVGMQLWQNNQNEIENVNNSIESLQQKSTEGAKNIKEALKKTEIPDKSRATLEDYKQKVNDIKEVLKEYDPIYEKTFRDVDAVDGQGKAVHSLQKQYEILRDRLLGVKVAYEKLYDLSNAPSELDKSSGKENGWDTLWMGSDTFSTAAETYQKNIDELDKYIAKLSAKNKDLKTVYEDLYNYIWSNLEKKDDEAILINAQGSLDKLSSYADKIKYLLSKDYTHRGKEGSNYSFLKGYDESMAELSGMVVYSKLRFDEKSSNMAENLTNYLQNNLGITKDENKEEWETWAKFMMDGVLNLTGLPENAKTAIEKGFFKTTGIIEWVEEGDIPTENKYARGGNSFKDKQYDAIDALVNKLSEAEKEDGESAAGTIKDIVKNGKNSVDVIENMQKHIKTLRTELKLLANVDDAESLKEKKRIEYELKYAEAAAKAGKYSTDKPSNKKGTDTIKKGFEEEIRLAKEAYAEYKKWYDLLNNEKAATAKVGENPLFQDEEGKAIFGNPKDILANYKDILERIGDRYPDLQRKLQSAIFDFNYDEAKDSAAKAVSVMKEQLDRETKGWSIYKKLFEATGDKSFALDASKKNLKVWDEQTTQWAEDLRQKMMERTGDVGKSYGFDFNMNEEEAKKYFGENGDLVELYMRTKKQIEENGINFWGDYAEMVNGAQTFSQQIEVLKDKRDKAIAAAQTAGMSKPEIDNIARGYNNQISKIEFDKLKFSLNWDNLLGGAQSAEKSLLKGARDAMKKFKKSKEYENMNPAGKDSVNKAIQDMSKAIESKNGGLFGGLIDASRQLNDAFAELYEAQAEYNGVAETGTELEKQLAQQRVNNAKNGVYAAQNQVRNEKNDLKNGVNGIVNAAKALGTATDHPLAAVGSALGSIGAALGETGELYTGIIGAIFTLLDAIGDDFNGFLGNILESVGHAVGGILETVGNLFGISGLGDIFGGADYSEYDSMVSRFGALNDVWDSILQKKKAYIKESWAGESIQASEEAKRLVESELEIKKALAKARLGSGASAGSHSMWYRMWKGSYSSVLGRTWNMVAPEISQKYGVPFDSMYDMLDMSGETLQNIKENYSDLWAAMDTDFRNYLEDIIKYQENIDEINESLQERITQTSFDALRDSFVDSLMDMDSTATDFANNFSKLMMNAMVNNHLLGGEFDKWLDGWWKRMKDAVAAGDLDAQNRLNAEAQRKREELLGERDMIAEAINYSSGNNNSSASSSIKGVSEETADILAAYMNGIRADVSITRSLIEELDIQSLNAVAASQLAQLNMIAANTEAIMNSNNDIRDDLRELRYDFESTLSGTKKISIQ